jgi:phage-related protein
MVTDDDQLVRRNIFSKIKKGFQNLGHDIKHVAQKVGSGIKKAAQTVGSGIKKAAQTVGHGIKTAAKTVGHFVKTTGAKVAKFGLKVVQSVGMAIGDVASFIPEVGKGVQQAINGVSKVAGVISDHIHAKLSKNLMKGMNTMNTANKIMSYVRRDLSDEAFQQRDISKTYYSGSREADSDLDDISLTLEHSYFDNDDDLDYELWD